MDLALLVALAVTAALLVVACALLAVVLAGSRSTRRALVAARAEVEVLAARVEQVEHARTATPAVPEPGFLITDAGLPAPAHPDEGSDGPRTSIVLSAVLAEPLVKAMAFGYAVRRALSPENRNRIRFEMRREVRRARKQRRRDARRVRRQEAAA